MKVKASKLEPGMKVVLTITSNHIVYDKVAEIFLREPMLNYNYITFPKDQEVEVEVLE